MDYALICPDHESFAVYHDAVTDKERLWIEFLTKYPEKICTRWWTNRRYAPPISVTSNHDLMLKAITASPVTAEYISDSLAGNIESVQKFLQCNKQSFLYMNPKVYQHFPFLMTIEKIRPFVVDEIRADDDDITAYLYMKSSLLSQRIPTQHWGNRQFVRAWFSCTQRHHRDFRRISKEFWNDRSFVIEFIAHESSGYIYEKIINMISQRLWNDRRFIREFISNGGQLNKHMKKSYLDDEEIIINYTKNFTWEIHRIVVLVQ